MLFRTELHPKPAPFQLNHASKVVTVGSCFSEVIGRQLEKYKVDTLTNPFGTIFNPLSVCKLLQVCAGADVELADSFVQQNGRWFSYDFHSSFSATNEEDLYENLDEVIVKTRRFLKQTDVLILTFGTANVFRHNISGETVANCHKMPGNTFTRETLLPEEIIAAVAETQSLLRELNPKLRLVVTVSPVRHLKDTLELNSVSKSVLRLASHFLSQQLPDIFYFPAYELLLDDLRDYRFYKEDLLHPTAAAEQYIWEKFLDAYFEAPFREFTRDWDKVLRALEHKPFYPESEQHQAFVQQMLERLRGLEGRVPVENELAYFESQVIIPPVPEEEPEETEDEELSEEEEITEAFETAEEEIVEQPAEALEDALAEAAEDEMQAVLSDVVPAGKKRKKKPRKKKKKPAAGAEIALTEVGTAPEETAAAENAPETLETIMDLLETPVHEIEHSGETLSETPASQIKPAATRSKSAKRRDSRRKKKALAAQEQSTTSEIQEGMPDLVIPGELEVPVYTFYAENATVLEEKTAALPETMPEEVPAAESKKPAKKGRKKPAFPELFVTETPVAVVPIAETLAESTIAEPLTAPQPAPEPVQPEPVQKRRGRPKKEKPVAEAAPVLAETPIIEAVIPEEFSVEAALNIPMSAALSEDGKKRKPAARKPATPKPAVAKATVSKPAVKAKPKKEPTSEVPEKPKAARPGRKKKTEPES
jgi:hypothetical protein